MNSLKNELKLLKLTWNHCLKKEITQRIRDNSHKFIIKGHKISAEQTSVDIATTSIET